MPISTFQKLSMERQTHILNSGIQEFSNNSFSEASTDSITKKCGISKGILFHYFGSKKVFYLYCLTESAERLINQEYRSFSNDFYDLIYSIMDKKFLQYRNFPDEMNFLSIASKEMNQTIFKEKNNIIDQYLEKEKENTLKRMEQAVFALKLKTSQFGKAVTAFMMYTETVLNRYLDLYKDCPEEFLESSGRIQEEIKTYLDFMLFGVAEQKSD